MFLLDPESLSFVQWFWIVLTGVLIVFFACRAIDLYYPMQLMQTICPVFGIACA
jgi:hypothetical protein